MTRSIRIGIRVVLSGLLATMLAASPASASAEPVAAPESEQCVLEPGVYGIVNSRGEIIGLLIVYPDCRLEVYVPTSVA